MKKELLFFGEVGKAITGDWLNAEIKDLKKEDSLHLVVHSPGGSVIEGNFICGILARCKAQISAEIVGMCASMATVIVSCIPKVSMHKNALFLIHSVSGFVAGNSKKMAQELEIMNKLDNLIIQNYAAKTGKKTDEIKNKYFDGNDHWLTAEEAKSAGLVDEVLASNLSKGRVNFSARGAMMQDFVYKYAAISSKQFLKNNTMTNIKNPKVLETENSLDALKATILSQSKEMERFKTIIAEKDAEMKGFKAENEKLSTQTIADTAAKNAEIEKMNADYMKVLAENEGLVHKLQKKDYDNAMNLSLSKIIGANGKPLSDELIYEIKANFNAQHRIKQEGKGVQIFSIAKNEIIGDDIGAAVRAYAFNNKYVVKAQRGAGFQPGNSDIDEGSADNLTEKNRRWAALKEEMRRQKVPLFSKDWNNKMKEAGYNI